MDSIEKKIRAVKDICKELGLVNVIPVRDRFGNLSGSYDYITGRAVTRLPEFYCEVKKFVSAQNHHTFPNGVIYLTGGDVAPELSGIKAHNKIYCISDHFEDPYFLTKKVVHLYESSGIKG